MGGLHQCSHVIECAQIRINGEEVGLIMNLTRERIRQVEVSGLEKLQAEEFALDLEDVFRS